MKVVNRCTSFIYELVSKYGAKSTKENPSIFLTLFRKRLGDLNSQYMSLKWNEKKFPQLKTVSVLFSNMFCKSILYIARADYNKSQLMSII